MKAIVIFTLFMDTNVCINLNIRISNYHIFSDSKTVTKSDNSQLVSMTACVSVYSACRNLIIFW